MIVMRCHASDQWGLGNLTRCRALARALKAEGSQVAMVGPSIEMQQPGDVETFEHWQPLDWQNQSTENARELLEIANQFKAQSLVIDDPRADADFQEILYAEKIKWLQFDGTATKPMWANWILNALPSANAHTYSTVVRNPSARLLLGPMYAVLRQEFARTEKKPKLNPDDISILLIFGGGDDRGAIAWCLQSLKPLLNKNTKLKIISGSANPQNNTNLKIIEGISKEQIEYFIQPAHPWEIMSTCDLAVMASGTTVHEVNVFQLPMVLMSVVENQDKPGQAWAQAAGAKYLGDWNQLHSELLRESVLSQLKELHMQKTPALVDGLGASRVAKVLCEQLN